ncbi:UNKNOWN [Stylonychia lemnae]|uniref:Uncharacterized protein n=1 Tax=Stylonychia lemnae TaxID=5949 RepID=A0A078BD03_STYLE|nr:UNKNOWN [Stylonychia lemnae]|eukprot:CDW91473.1 UNKNOWN [Stylonychia lemnae]
MLNEGEIFYYLKNGKLILLSKNDKEVAEFNNTRPNINIRNSKEQKEKKAYIFIDSKNAYDAVNRGAFQRTIESLLNSSRKNKNSFGILQKLFFRNEQIYGCQKIQVNTDLAEKGVTNSFLLNLYLDFAVEATRLQRVQFNEKSYEHSHTMSSSQ